VALWLAVFSLPLFLFTPDRQSAGLPATEAVRRGLAQLRRTFANLRRYRAIGRFLIARMIYTDGLNTLFAFGGIYAAGTFGMPMAEVILFGAALNVTGAAGAILFAWIDDWIGPRRTIAIALAALVCTSTGVLLIQSKTWFWVLGLMLGFFIGPAQAASRSLMARVAPPSHRSQMFGLFALSGRVTAFIGPALLASVTAAAANQRAGMATVVLFLITGLVLLLTKVPERALAAAQEPAAH
jgi:UMF1 family MFS transporter